MTEHEFLEKKDSLNNQYEDIDNKMDELGYQDYNDISGDVGIRRLYKDNILVSQVFVHDMVPNYMGDYPDFQFYEKERDIYINSVDDLVIK